MITLKRLEWSNLFSYAADNSIELDREPITQLIGQNGHGKSSIPLILEEVLFNKNSKGIKKADIPNRELNTTKYSAVGIFSIDNKNYSLEVSRSGAVQKVKLLEDGVDISSHTATATFSQVEALFGLDFKTFSQLVYQNRNSSLQFLTATDSNRKKFLIELLSLDRYVNIFDSIKATHKEVSDTLLKLQSKEATIRSWLVEVSKQDLVEIGLQEVPQLDSTKPIILGDLTAQLSSINSTNIRIQNNKHYKSRLESIDASSLVQKRLFLDPKPLTVKYTEVKHDLKAHNATLTKYKDISSGTCHACAQPVNLEVIDSIRSSTKTTIFSLSELEQKLKKELEDIEENNRLVKEHQALVLEFEKFSSLIDSSLPTIMLDKDSIEKSIKELNTYITSINKVIKEVTDINNKASAHNAKIYAITSQLDGYTKQLAELTIELAGVSKQLSILEILKKAFSNTGLVAYKIENSIKTLEELTNRYLAELSSGRFQIFFALNNDKLNVKIIDNSKEIEITALSAGELARVTIGTLLAIRKLMATLSKSQINILFLDEVIDSLDLDGQEKLIEVLLQEETLNTFLVSHSYSHPLVAKLDIIKENGISRIEYGN